jgi:hypothetical protein
MNSPDPAIVEYVQRRLLRTRHRDSERHTLARREAARIRAHAYDSATEPAEPFTVRMMPGQPPYTPDELRRLHALVRDAAAGDPGEANE